MVGTKWKRGFCIDFGLRNDDFPLEIGIWGVPKRQNFPPAAGYFLEILFANFANMKGILFANFCKTPIFCLKFGPSKWWFPLRNRYLRGSKSPKFSACGGLKQTICISCSPPQAWKICGFGLKIMIFPCKTHWKSDFFRACGELQEVKTVLF